MAAGSRQHPPPPGSPPKTGNTTLGRLAEELALVNKQASAAPQTPTEDDVLRLALLSASSGWRPSGRSAAGTPPLVEDHRVAAKALPLAEARAPPGIRSGGSQVAPSAAPRAPHEAEPLPASPRLAAAPPSPQSVPLRAPPPWLSVARRPPSGARLGAELRTPSFAEPVGLPSDVVFTTAAAARAQPSQPNVAVPPPPQAATRLGNPRAPSEEIQRIRQSHEQQLSEVRAALGQEQRRARELREESQAFLQKVESGRRLAAEVEGLRARLRESELEAARREASIQQLREEADATGLRVTSLKEERVVLERQLWQQRDESRAEEARLSHQVQQEIAAQQVMISSAERERGERADARLEAQAYRSRLLGLEGEVQHRLAEKAQLEKELGDHRESARRWQAEAEDALRWREEAEAAVAARQRLLLPALQEELAQARSELEEREAQISEQRRENVHLAAITRCAAVRDSSEQAELGQALQGMQAVLGRAQCELASLKAHVRAASQEARQRPVAEVMVMPTVAGGSTQFMVVADSPIDTHSDSHARTPHFFRSPGDSPASLAPEELANLRAEFAERLAAVLREGDAAVGALHAEISQLRQQNHELQLRVDVSKEAAAASHQLSFGWWEELLAPLRQRCEGEARARDAAERQAAQCHGEMEALAQDAAHGRAEAAAYEVQVAAAKATVQAVLGGAPRPQPAA